MGRPSEPEQPQKLTAAERSEIARRSWAKRTPAYEPNKTITLRPDVWNALDERRGGLTWAEFLCGLAGIPPPPDRRRNR